MTCLPVLRRELAAAARRTATYRQRVIFGAIAVTIVVVMFGTLPQTRLNGPKIFIAMSVAGFALCLLEGLRASADLISLERREGTLGLILLTDLRGPQILAGKLIAAAVQSLTTVISMLPAFALPLLIGGVTGGECWRVMLTLLMALSLALSIGICTSAMTRGPLAAFAAAMLLLIIVLVVPGLLSMGGMLGAFPALAGPLEMLRNVADNTFAAADFWQACVVTVMTCVGLIVGGGLLLHRFPKLEPKHSESALERWLRPRPGRGEAWGGPSTQSSPATWLAERTLPGRRMLWLFVLLGCGACFFAGVFGGRMATTFTLGCEMVFGFILKLWLAAVAPLSLNTSRRTGALELLLCTPISPKDIVRGQVDALYSYFLAPAMCLGVGFTVAVIVGMGVGQNSKGLSQEPWSILFGVFWLMHFMLDLHALAYNGLWNGLTHARLDRAVAKTAFSVLVLPWLTVVVPFLGCLGFLGWPIFWINWSAGRLEKRFRSEAVKQLSADAEETGWLPWSRKHSNALD